MKINFDRLFNIGVDKYKTFLIFGNNSSVQERAKSYLLHGRDPLTTITEAQYLEGAPTQQMSLFEDEAQKDVFVTGVTDKTLQRWQQESRASRVFFHSTTLRTSSRLVKALQSSDMAVAVGCYESPLLRPEFNFYVKAYNLDVTKHNSLFEAYRYHPEEFYNFMKTLELIHDGENLDDVLGHIVEMIPRVEVATNPLLSTDACQLAKADSVPASLQIPQIRSYLKTVHALYTLKCNGYRKEKLRPPLFFKDEPLYLAAARRWSLGQLKGIHDALLALEKRSKQGNPKRFDYEMFHVEHF